MAHAVVGGSLSMVAATIGYVGGVVCGVGLHHGMGVKRWSGRRQLGVGAGRPSSIIDGEGLPPNMTKVVVYAAGTDRHMLMVQFIWCMQLGGGRVALHCIDSESCQ